MALWFLSTPLAETPHNMTMEGEKLKVITAGGAASAGKAKKKHKKKPKSKVAEQPSSTTNDATMAAGGQVVTLQNAASPKEEHHQFALELEQSEREHDDFPLDHHQEHDVSPSKRAASILDESVDPVQMETLIQEPPPPNNKKTELFWLFLCFLGIMASFVVYGVLLEYTTSGGRKLHELSFLFVTSGLYTLTAAAGRYVRAETPTTIPPARFAILGLTSMGSTFCSVRSLR